MRILLRYLFLSLCANGLSAQNFILEQRIAGDQLVVLEATKAEIEESREAVPISEEKLQALALEAFSKRFRDFPAKISGFQLEKTAYVYRQDHPPAQKDFDYNYYRGTAFVMFKDAPNHAYEINFLMLPDGSFRFEEREYHPEFLHYQMSYRDGKLVKLVAKDR